MARGSAGWNRKMQIIVVYNRVRSVCLVLRPSSGIPTMAPRREGAMAESWWHELLRAYRQRRCGDGPQAVETCLGSSAFIAFGTIFFLWRETLHGHGGIGNVESSTMVGQVLVTIGPDVTWT